MASSNGHHPSTEVQPRTNRRRFTADYKRRIVEEAAACQYGEVGALLRREGLYHSNLRKWRAEYEAGTLRTHDTKTGKMGVWSKNLIRRLFSSGYNFRIIRVQGEQVPWLVQESRRVKKLY